MLIIGNSLERQCAFRRTGQTQIEMLRAASYNSGGKSMPNWGIFLQKWVSSGEKPEAPCKTRCCPKDEASRARGRLSPGAEKRQDFPGPTCCPGTQEAPLPHSGHGCAQSSEQIAAGPVHTGHGGRSANKGVKRGLWYGVSRDCRPLWSPVNTQAQLGGVLCKGCALLLLFFLKINCNCIQ